jgi:hypothetical protein
MKEEKMSKQSSINHIRTWVRTNGDMSEDGKSITYSCAELEAVIKEAKQMEKEQITDSYIEGHSIYGESTNAEQYYNDTYGETKN